MKSTNICILFCVLSDFASGEGKELIMLKPPDLSRGLTVMKALAARGTQRRVT